MNDRRPELTAAIDAADLPDIIEDTTGRACPRNGGTIRDPRLGYEEGHASFSVFRHGQVWFFKRRGAGEGQGTAWHFLLSLGWTDDEAAEYLISRAGLCGGALPERRLRPAKTALERAIELAAAWTPLTRTEAVDAWAHVGPLDAAGAQDLARRGLLHSPVLQVGSMTRDQGWAKRGGVAFGIHGPQGHLIAVKVRQPAGVEPRFVLRTKDRGSPPWCSPGYGRASTVLIVEGEWNAAAAAHAAHVMGLDLDVQGLPGVDTDPHLDGLDRQVLLYLDQDEGHQEAQARLTELALGCAATHVERLSALPNGQDFCDVLGQQGPAALAALLVSTQAAPSLHAGAFLPDYSSWPLMPPRNAAL
ncbi:hypothetical protein [Deinococcus multiflagellatus]|uniref:hypothetical protein n=1 Tax=Deinococcus multiflagellatus TaxID=1656887 RepID=UPI001CCBB6D1|nr:hypothetical protein [Deinococcus multiflagellatus]MBZ9714470.1 hypothetical protein [Deinococcus multiflagellatus]